MTDTLTTTSYAVLAQVAVRPWSTYELAQQRVRYFRYVWPRAESAIYREVKRLASMGLIQARKEYIGKRSRTIYSITTKGEKELRAWLDTPVSPFAMEFEALIHLFAAPFGTKEQILATLEQVRADAQQMLQFGAMAKQEYLDGVNVTQNQLYIRVLAIDFFISLLNTINAWAERTLAEIESWEDLTPAGKNERGMDILKQLPIPTLSQPRYQVAVPPAGQLRSRSSRSPLNSRRPSRKRTAI